MANANAGVPRKKVFHGARAYIVIDGKTVGYVTDVQVTVTMEHQPVDVLDSLEVEEFVPVAYTVNGSFGAVKVVGRSMLEAGIRIPIEDVLSAGDATFEIKDRPEDKAVAAFEGVKVTGTSFDVRKRGITNERMPFVAKRMRDEAGLVG